MKRMLREGVQEGDMDVSHLVEYVEGLGELSQCRVIDLFLTQGATHEAKAYDWSIPPSSEEVSPTFMMDYVPTLQPDGGGSTERLTVADAAVCALCVLAQ